MIFNDQGLKMAISLQLFLRAAFWKLEWHFLKFGVARLEIFVVFIGKNLLDQTQNIVANKRFNCFEFQTYLLKIEVPALNNAFVFVNQFYPQGL